MRLSSGAQQIAEVIGRDKALYLIGKLPANIPPSDRALNGGGTRRVALYVPRVDTLTPDHRLVRLVGWLDAKKLCIAYGGEIIQCGDCRSIYRAYRERSIIEFFNHGDAIDDIADWFDVTPQYVKAVLRKPYKDISHNNDNNPTKRIAGLVNAVA